MQAGSDGTEVCCTSTAKLWQWRLHTRCAVQGMLGKQECLLPRPVIINAFCYTVENCSCILHRYDLLKQSAAPTIGIMVEPSVSFMSAFLPKASLLVGLSFAAFYSQQHLKVLGGNLPSRDMATWKPEHKEAEKRRFLNMVTCSLCFCLSLLAHLQYVQPSAWSFPVSGTGGST